VSALRVENLNFTEKEQYIRDCFDTLFYYMGTMQHHEENAWSVPTTSSTRSTTTRTACVTTRIYSGAFWIITDSAESAGFWIACWRRQKRSPRAGSGKARGACMGDGRGDPRARRVRNS
jgi:hypothetical protein